MNKSKTEFVLLSASGSDERAQPGRNLVVTFGQQETDSVIEASFFQLHLLAKVKSFLSPNDLKKALQAFIRSRNALYIGFKPSLIAPPSTGATSLKFCALYTGSPLSSESDLKCCCLFSVPFMA